MIDKTKKLTLFLASLDGGGIQKAAMHLIQEFSKRDIRVTLVVVNAKGQLRKEVPEDCTLVDLGCQKTRYTFYRLTRYLWSERPAIAISSQTHLNVLIIFIRMLIGFPKHLIVREHITFNNEIIQDKRLTEKLRPWLIQTFYPFASRFVTVSKSSAKSIYQFTGIHKEIQVIQNGLDIELIHQKVNEPSEHRWLKNKDIKLIIGLGRLTHQKDFPTLLKAFSQLEAIQNYRLIILGEGAELTRLKNLSKELNIQEYVDFPGFVDNPFPFLARANIFVLSSRWEGFANVVIEALACGLPIVATDCPGGPSDILAGQSFARIVPMDNSPAITCAIEELLASKHEKTTIIKYAENFNIQNVAQQYIDLMNDLQ